MSTESSPHNYWSGPGGARQVLQIAFPLIVSTSFWTLQMTIDRILLSRYSSDAVGAAQIAIMVFWTVFALLHQTALYSSTFVAQYQGANKPDRIGPVIWQSLYFSLISGVIFCTVFFFSAEWFVSLAGHGKDVQILEAKYLQTLSFSALPMALVASASSFFMGRGKTGVVMIINAAGLVVNALLDYALIFGQWGFPELGIAGAGWATTISSAVSALLALALLFRPSMNKLYGLWNGWHFDRALFGRLLRFGLPAGLQWSLDGLAFTVFVFLIGKMGKAELAANSIAFSINLLAFLPPMGLGQAVSVLVGQRLGENRPDLAERSANMGCIIGTVYMLTMGATFLIFPGMYLSLYQSHNEPEQWLQVAAMVPILLRFAAVFCLFDSINMVLSFALKGAGDTKFVSIISLTLAWSIVVPPTIAIWYWGLGIYWAWAVVTLYVFALASVLFWRFRQGKWKSMRVIENAPTDTDEEVGIHDDSQVVPEPVTTAITVEKVAVSPAPLGD